MSPSVRAARLWLVAAVVAVGAVTGCEKVNRVASSVSPCFRGLPIAHDALGGQGSATPVDVARARGSSIPKMPFLRRRPSSASTTTLPGAPPRPQRDVCLIAYRGPFDPARIPVLSDSTRVGRFAVVVIAVRTQRIVSVFLTDQLPAPLHAH